MILEVKQKKIMMNNHKNQITKDQQSSQKTFKLQNLSLEQLKTISGGPPPADCPACDFINES